MTAATASRQSEVESPHGAAVELAGSAGPELAGPGDPAALAGAKPGRLVAIDLLRGYFILMLASIHLDYVPSIFGYVDGRGRLWVSEAEGFFFISGLLVAMMRRKDLERSGFRQATRRSWSRALKLYAVACSLCLIYTALGRVSVALNWSGAKPGLDTTSSWSRVLINTLDLHYVYGWADFLTFYAPLFVIAPVLVWLMSHKLSWLVALASIAAYVSMSFDTAFWGAAGAFVQWQVHFVLGMVLGYHLPELQRWLKTLSARTRAWLSGVAVGSAAALYGIGMITLWSPSVRPTGHMYDLLIFDNRLGLLRPLFTVVMFAGGFVLISKLQRPIMATVGNLLTLFGQNSLYVYVIQSLLVFTVPFITGSRGVVFNTALDVLLMAIVWLGLKKQFLFKVIPR
ncbi:MAG: hypothetical protein JWO63_1827 [Frankiales bacterium]|nr:hypothetical protein [Frankiales bacterium]